MIVGPDVIKQAKYVYRLNNLKISSFPDKEKAIFSLSQINVLR